MGYIAKNWREVKNGILSQKFLDRVRPEARLKNKMYDAGKKMESQILRLEQTHTKLKQNYDHIFKKIVECKRNGNNENESRAKTYAIELQEIKKAKNKIAEAKLAMEQIKLRLSTVSELGDIVVTLSPCMSLIKGLAPSISSFMPQMQTSMEDLSNVFDGILTDSSLSQESISPLYQKNADADAILNEAHNVIERKTKTSMPEPPTTSSQYFSKEKESML